jgi:hypothetical protein
MDQLHQIIRMYNYIYIYIYSTLEYCSITDIFYSNKQL